jgi:flap endonuclease-1
MDEFIDLCILLGCDYCDSIKGIGPKRAIELMKTHRSIEKILEKLDTKKYQVPENWPYKEARGLFKEPEIEDPKSFDLKWVAPDEEAVVAYLVGEKGFAEDRIRNGCKKLAKARQTSTQGRLDGFFKVISTSPAVKRPAEDKKGGDKKKSRGGGGGSKFRRGK